MARNILIFFTLAWVFSTSLSRFLSSAWVTCSYVVSVMVVQNLWLFSETSIKIRQFNWHYIWKTNSKVNFDSVDVWMVRFYCDFEWYLSLIQMNQIGNLFFYPSIKKVKCKIVLAGISTDSCRLTRSANKLFQECVLMLSFLYCLTTLDYKFLYIFFTVVF